MSDRPFRDKLEKALDKVPSGPRGKVGEGDVVGTAGVLAVESSRPFINAIPGVKQPGYNVNSHGVEAVEGGTRHTFTVDALSKDVAEAAAQYVASHSNIGFVTSDIELRSTKMLRGRSTYSTFKITVDVLDPE